MASLSYYTKIPQDEYLIREDEKGVEIFLLLSGRASAEIKVTGKDEPETLAEFRQGDFFGEMILLGSYRRTASVKALDNLEVLIWPKDDLNRLFEQNTHIGYIVMRNFATSLSNRLLSADMEIHELLIERLTLV